MPEPYCMPSTGLVDCSTHSSHTYPCPPSAQLSRLMTRDGSSVQHASARMAAQMPLEHKARLAQLRLYNDGSMQQLREQVRGLWALKGGLLLAGLGGSVGCAPA